MGHNIHYATYPENVNKKIVQNEWDEYAAHGTVNSFAQISSDILAEV